MLRIDARKALRTFTLDVQLEVGAGRCLALAGPSGAGKSTVLRIVAGIVTPDAGAIVLGGEPWFDAAAGVDLPPEARRCGYVFQDYALFPHLNVWQNVAYGLRGPSRTERRARAVGLLDRFGIEPLAEARPARLSGGEQQRVALARALALDPDVLLLDEPLSALDARTRARAARELASTLAEIAVPTILVTHDFTEAALFGDAVAIVDQGRVVQHGAAVELAAKPATAFVADLAGAVVLSGRASPGPDGITLVALDGGGHLESVDAADGEVAATIYPWEITLLKGSAVAPGSAQNALAARVESVTEIGNRSRVGLVAGQPFVAEITGRAARELALAVGDDVTAVFKATATRLVRRTS